MKPFFLIYALYIAVISTCFSSCTKNNTQYYGDDKDTGIAIFSNKGFNTMSCYVNAIPWKTIDRIEVIGGSNSPSYEVSVSMLAGQNAQDTLQISWVGNFADMTDSFQNQSLIMAKLVVPHSFSYAGFSSLQGNKYQLNGTNGYFSTSLKNAYPTTIIKGTGNIYFNRAQLDSISQGNNTGLISGLFDADINGLKITSGRFDDSLDGKSATLSR